MAHGEISFIGQHKPSVYCSLLFIIFRSDQFLKTYSISSILCCWCLCLFDLICVSNIVLCILLALQILQFSVSLRYQLGGFVCKYVISTHCQPSNYILKNQIEMCSSQAFALFQAAGYHKFISHPALNTFCAMC